MLGLDIIIQAVRVYVKLIVVGSCSIHVSNDFLISRSSWLKALIDLLLVLCACSCALHLCSVTCAMHLHCNNVVCNLTFLYDNVLDVACARVL